MTEELESSSSSERQVKMKTLVIAKARTTSGTPARSLNTAMLNKKELLEELHFLQVGVAPSSVTACWANSC